MVGFPGERKGCQITTEVGRKPETFRKALGTIPGRMRLKRGMRDGAVSGAYRLWRGEESSEGQGPIRERERLSGPKSIKTGEEQCRGLGCQKVRLTIVADDA